MSRLDELLDLYDVKRDDWDPNDNTPRQNREVDVIDAFELHHTGGPGPRSLSFEDKLRWGLGIESFHENNKGWTDLFYNVFVFADGEIWGGRRPDRSSQGDLRQTLTVHVPGNNPTITEAQHRSLLRVARWCTSNPDHVRGHSDRAVTACPGDSGRRELIRIRQEIAMPDLSNLPPIQIVPEDLRDHEDYLEAVKRGFIGNSDPDRVASRSVVGIVATRVDDANTADWAALQGQILELGDRIAALEAAKPSDVVLTESVKQAIVDELVKRLAE